MAYSLVGTIGTIVQGATGATVNPSWGAGESRTAGNLLLLAVGDSAATSQPATPSGWTLGPHATDSFLSNFCAVSLFYKIAAGGDAAPSITGVGGAAWSAQLAEFTGNVSSSPLDQSLGGARTTPFTNPASDATAGELIFFVDMNITNNNVTASANNGATLTRSSSALSTWWGVTTGNSTADSITTSGAGLPDSRALASFKVASTPVVTLSTSTLLSLGVG